MSDDDKPAEPAPDAAAPAAPRTTDDEWWCATCRVVVPPDAVTFYECHDVRAGGCGERVGTRPVPPAPAATCSGGAQWLGIGCDLSAGHDGACMVSVDAVLRATARATPAATGDIRARLRAAVQSIDDPIAHALRHLLDDPSRDPIASTAEVLRAYATDHARLITLATTNIELNAVPFVIATAHTAPAAPSEAGEIVLGDGRYVVLHGDGYDHSFATDADPATFARAINRAHREAHARATAELRERLATSEHDEETAWKRVDDMTAKLATVEQERDRLAIDKRFLGDEVNLAYKARTDAHADRDAALRAQEDYSVLANDKSAEATAALSRAELAEGVVEAGRALEDAMDTMDLPRHVEPCLYAFRDKLRAYDAARKAGE